MKSALIALAAAFALTALAPAIGSGFVAPAQAKAKKCTSAQLQSCSKKCKGTAAQKNQCSSECIIKCNEGIL